MAAVPIYFLFYCSGKYVASQVLQPKTVIKDYQIECITINRFFGVHAEGEHKFMSKFDSSVYNCIIFDEIYVYNVSLNKSLGIH